MGLQSAGPRSFRTGHPTLAAGFASYAGGGGRGSGHFGVPEGLLGMPPGLRINRLLCVHGTHPLPPPPPPANGKFSSPPRIFGLWARTLPPPPQHRTGSACLGEGGWVDVGGGGKCGGGGGRLATFGGMPDT